MHWPPFIGQPRRVPEGVYLQEKHRHRGDDMRVGDRVFVYETVSPGPLEVHLNRNTGQNEKMPRQPGKGAVIALLKVTEILDVDPEAGSHFYSSGGGELAVMHWRRLAHTTPINVSGRIKRERLNVLMGRKTDFKMRLYGGLEKLKPEHWPDIREEFVQSAKQRRPPAPAATGRDVRHGSGDGGGEGPEHEGLKNRVWNNPSRVIREPGLTAIAKEYKFVTADRADVILADALGRYVTVEIKVDISAGDITGVLQAVKYKHMYAIACNRQFEEVRAILVAYSIPKDVRQVCRAYGVQCCIVKRVTPRYGTDDSV